MIIVKNVEYFQEINEKEDVLWFKNDPIFLLDFGSIITSAQNRQTIQASLRN